MQFSSLDYLDARRQRAGFCLNCEQFVKGPLSSDAQREKCPKCRKHTVYGAECSHLFGFIRVTSQSALDQTV